MAFGNLDHSNTLFVGGHTGTITHFLVHNRRFGWVDIIPANLVGIEGTYTGNTANISGSFTIVKDMNGFLPRIVGDDRNQFVLAKVTDGVATGTAVFFVDSEGFIFKILDWSRLPRLIGLVTDVLSAKKPTALRTSVQGVLRVAHKVGNSDIEIENSEGLDISGGPLSLLGVSIEAGWFSPFAGGDHVYIGFNASDIELNSVFVQASYFSDLIPISSSVRPEIVKRNSMPYQFVLGLKDYSSGSFIDYSGESFTCDIFIQTVANPVDLHIGGFQQYGVFH
jgi:hypothetical protein